MIGGEEISMIPVIEYTLWGRNFDFCEDQAGIETVTFVEHGDVLKRLGWNELGNNEDHKVTR